MILATLPSQFQDIKPGLAPEVLHFGGNQLIFSSDPTLRAFELDKLADAVAELRRRIPVDQLPLELMTPAEVDATLGAQS